MHPDAIEIDADNEAAPKIRLQTLGHLDGRTVAAKRARELIAGFEAELGELTLSDRLAVRRAAMLCALAEHEASRQMSGETTDIDQTVRLSNAALRAVAALRLPARNKRQPTGPSLAEHLAKHASKPADASVESEEL